MLTEQQAISLAVRYHNYLSSYEMGFIRGEYYWAKALIEIGKDTGVWPVSEDTLVRRMTLAAQKLGE